MLSSIVVTNSDWTASLKRNSITNNVNFWRRDTRVTHLLPGTAFYFKHKGQNRISGRGFLREQRTLTIAQAWAAFGKGNGVENEGELTDRATSILKLPDDRLNCFILDSVEILEPSQWPVLPEGAFPRQVVAAKFFTDDAIADVVAAFHVPIVSPSLLVGEQAAVDEGAFDPSNVTSGRTFTLRSISSRRGQSCFRNQLLVAYENRCAISEESNDFVLEAAHIFPYRGLDTNRTQNGLLLRSDWHTLFDLGLWTLNEDLSIHISSKLSASSYGLVHGKFIRAPKHKADCPARAALAFHRTEIFTP